MAELGNTRRVYIVAGTGSTYTVMKGEQSNSVNRSAEEIDTSDKDTGSWGSSIPGKKTLTADFTVYADNTDSNQKQILEAFYEDQTIKIFIGKLSGSSPSEGEMFEATIVSVGDTNDVGAVATRTISVKSKGEPTLYPEP